MRGEALVLLSMVSSATIPFDPARSVRADFSGLPDR